MVPPPAASPRVSLDIWGTLLRSDPAFKPRRNRMLRDLLCPRVDPEVFSQALRSRDRLVDAQMMADGHHRGPQDRIADTLQALDSPVPGADDPRWQQAWETQTEIALEHPPLALTEDLPELVAACLQRGPEQVALTSNTGLLEGPLMRRLLQAAGFPPVPALAFSDEVEDPGSKPHPAIFRSTLAQLGARPAEVLHVGDNFVADVCGAAQAGMSRVLVDPQAGRDDAAPVPSTSRVLRAVLEDRLDELPVHRA